MGTNLYVKDYKLIKTLADVIRSDIYLIKSLKDFVINSKYSYLETSKIAAANAISILIAGNIPFIEEDLSDIKIPGANLRDGIFSKCNFSGADLKGANLRNCKMQECNFSKTFLTDVDIGHQSNIALFENITGLRLSSLRPEGYLLMSIHKFNKKVFLWEFETREKYDEITGQEGAFSPVGLEIAIAHDQNIQIWKAWKEFGKKHLNLLRTLEGHTQDVTVLHFSPDGFELFSGGLDTNILLWNLRNGSIVRSFVGHKDQISCLAYFPQNSLLVSGSFDGNVVIWNKNNGVHLKTVNLHKGPITSVNFLKNGEEVISSCEEKSSNVMIWSSKTGNLISNLNNSIHSGVKSLTLSQSGNHYVAVDHDYVRVFDCQMRNVLYSQKIKENVKIYSAIFDAEEKKIIIGGDDKSISFHDFTSAKSNKIYEGVDSQILSLTLSPDSMYLLAGCYDNSLRLWNRNNGKFIKTFQGHSGAVRSVAFSYDGENILSGGDDSHCILWNRKSGQKIETFKIDHKVNAVAFASDCQAFVCANDKFLKLYNISPKKTLASFESHTDIVTSVAYTQFGNKIVSGSLDNTIILWNLHGTVLKIFEGHSETIRSVGFSVDGTKIISCANDKTIKVWEQQSGYILKNFTLHSAEVSAVAYSSDGNKILSGSKDSKIKISSESYENELSSIDAHEGGVSCVGFSSDNQLIYSAGNDNIIRLWQKSTKEGNHSDYLLALEISHDETPMKFNDSIVSEAYDLSDTTKSAFVSAGAKAYYF